MIDTHTLTDEEFDQCLLKANAAWKNRLSKETRRIHYDHESDIIQLKFGNPGFIILHCLNNDPDGFEWVVEDDSLHIVGIEIFYFRGKYVPRHPKLQAAYDAMCRDWGEGDWHIHLPPQADSIEGTAGSTFADTLLDCARDPVSVPSSEI